MDVSERAPETDLLNDDGELSATMTADTIDRIREMDVPIDDEPVHLAKCAECAEAVRFRSNITGSGFFLVDADPDATFGIGSNGRPMCRNGHGEMEVADDRLPAAEAFADAQSMLLQAEGEAIQRSLPGVFPPFNFEGAYLELERQALSVDSLHKAHKAAAEEARDAKKAWDHAAELYTTMALELRRRRREKDGEPQDDADRQAAGAAGVTPTPCTWEAKRPYGTPCPLCRQTVNAEAVARMFQYLAPPDAMQHVDEVDQMLTSLDVDATHAALEDIDTYIDKDVIAEWSEADRAVVQQYAQFKRSFEAGIAGQLENGSTVTVERPALLGKPHIPAACVEGEHQVCQFCEVVIQPASEDRVPYKGTDYVGIGCPGKPVEANRYPSNRGKKTAAAKKIAPQPKPKAGKKAKR